MGVDGAVGAGSGDGAGDAVVSIKENARGGPRADAEKLLASERGRELLRQAARMLDAGIAGDAPHEAMAREAGENMLTPSYIVTMWEFDQCTVVIPPTEREKLTDALEEHARALEAAARRKERERCARECERLGSAVDGTMQQRKDAYWQQTTRARIRVCDDCARALRALEEKEQK